MSFSNEWEEIYRNQQKLGLWPWTDLVSYYMRYVKPQLKSQNPKILELGFGAGTNVPFYKSVGADFYGIEGSQTIVDRIKKAYPMYAKNIKCADFTKLFPYNDKFDVIVDRGAITCNDTVSIENTVKLIKNFLNCKNGGKVFIGIDWFSLSHSEFNSPAIEKDKYTKVFENGYYKGLGQIHFSDEEHIRKLFKDFKIIKLEHKTYTDHTKNEDMTKNDVKIKTFASWNFIAKLII